MSGLGTDLEALNPGLKYAAGGSCVMSNQPGFAVATNESNTQVAQGACRCFGVYINTTNTNPIVIVDSGIGGTGAPYTLAGASSAQGFYPMNQYMQYGIQVLGNAANPAVTVSWGQ